MCFRRITGLFASLRAIAFGAAQTHQLNRSKCFYCHPGDVEGLPVRSPAPWWGLLRPAHPVVCLSDYCSLLNQETTHTGIPHVSNAFSAMRADCPWQKCGSAVYRTKYCLPSIYQSSFPSAVNGPACTLKVPTAQIDMAPCRIFPINSVRVLVGIRGGCRPIGLCSPQLNSHVLPLPGADFRDG